MMGGIYQGEQPMIQRDLKLSTNHITNELITYIIDKIVWEIHPEKIILFGSHATGTATKDSDLDLFIIKDSEEENREIRRKSDLLLFGRRFGIDIIVRKPQEVEANLKDNNPFDIYHIFKDGKVIYDRKS